MNTGKLLLCGAASLVIQVMVLLSAVTATAQATGERPISLGVSMQLPSAILGEARTINIYLPAGYSTADTTTYPVIYVPDGGVEEDFIHFAGLVQYASQSWVGRCPRSIVVGIENTDRQRDFTFPVADLDFLGKVSFKREQMPHYGGSAKYIAFLEQELQPFIKRQYRTRSASTIIGESLGGLLATEIYVHHRSLFQNYIIISPSLWWGSERLLQDLKNNKAATYATTHVYIGAPQKNEIPLMFNDAEQLAVIIRNQKHDKLVFDYLPKETHATVSHQAVYNAFRWLYGKQ